MKEWARSLILCLLKPMLKPIVSVMVLGLCLVCATLHASDLGALQQLSSALKDKSSVSSYTLLVRHALAPGTGDPAEFMIDDCSTQRNLNQQGRQQSVKIGQLLQQAGLSELEVFSSQWCRCRDTATLVRESVLAAAGSNDGAIAEVADLPQLNSFFRDYERREPQTEELRGWLVKRAQSGSEHLALLVSHQVNITAITGVYPASGEIVIVKTAENGEVEVVATVETL